MELLNNGLDRTAGKFIFEKRISIRITNREEWVDGTHLELTYTKFWYTDGSKLDLNTGPAAWASKERDIYRLSRTFSLSVSIGNTGYKDVH